MYIIALEASSSGSRPPLQTWEHNFIPEGFAICPDEFYDIFYSTTPAGFVNIAVENKIVTSMTINQEALDVYIAENPESELNDQEPTPQDDVDAMLVDHEYRLTLLELGISE